MVGRIRFRVGDILTVSCPFTEAQVSAVRSGYVSIKWPWNRVDPDTPQFAWNGEVAVTSDPAHFDWKRELFRTDPAPQHLRPGAACRVGERIQSLRAPHLSASPARPGLDIGRPRHRSLLLHACDDRPGSLRGNDG